MFSEEKLKVCLTVSVMEANIFEAVWLRVGLKIHVTTLEGNIDFYVYCSLLKLEWPLEDTSIP